MKDKTCKKSKIMYDATYEMMREALVSVLNKENTDKTVKKSDGSIDYQLLVMKIKTEVAVVLDYVDRLEKENKK
ncbi:MAG: hypothetical protein IJ996_03740 [Clostridia bacterium]|nr:hypothetical protein [Clostridia bacterium]